MGYGLFRVTIIGMYMAMFMSLYTFQLIVVSGLVNEKTIRKKWQANLFLIPVIPFYLVMAFYALRFIYEQIINFFRAVLKNIGELK